MMAGPEAKGEGGVFWQAYSLSYRVIRRRMERVPQKLVMFHVEHYDSEAQGGNCSTWNMKGIGPKRAWSRIETPKRKTDYLPICGRKSRKFSTDWSFRGQRDGRGLIRVEPPQLQGVDGCSSRVALRAFHRFA